MSEVHRMKCDERLDGPLAPWCRYRADRRFRAIGSDPEFTVDVCQKHAERYLDDDGWEEVPLPKLTEASTLRELLREARESVARGIPSDPKTEAMYGEAFPNHRLLMAETRDLLTRIDAALEPNAVTHEDNQ